MLNKYINFKNTRLGLPLGKKTDIEVPKRILLDNILMRAFIRGLFDTDGSLTMWKTNNALYPRIYFSNISEKLVIQTKKFLVEQGFRVTSWKTPQNGNRKTVYKISINGIPMLRKWVQEINFSNHKNLDKVRMLGISQENKIL